MLNFVQTVVGIILLVIVVGGLLYLFYSRTNAIEKTGYGSLIMLALVTLLIPLFWIAESGSQVSAQNNLFAYAVSQGQQLYAADCTYECYGIDAKNKVTDIKYNGYTIDDLNKTYSDNDLTRIISAGIYNPKATYTPPSLNSIPKVLDYGGALQSNDINYLLAFIRSADPGYKATHGYPNVNGFDTLAAYVQANIPTQYAAAQTYAAQGQFGVPVDDTSMNAVTITINDPGKGGATCSQTACYTPIHIKVKVGTTITWINKSSLGHTVTAIVGNDTSTHKPAPQIFDSANGDASKLVATNQSFSYKVTADAYNFNTDHTVIYYCRIHPDMLAKLTIVQ